MSGRHFKPSARHQARRAAALASVRVGCTECGKALIPALRHHTSPSGKKRCEAAMKLHAPRCPGAHKFRKAVEGARSLMVEHLCAGCGVIVDTLSVELVRADPEAAQAQVSLLLKAHIELTGCVGEYNGAKGQPKRRDARCLDGMKLDENGDWGAPAAHAEGCRCDLTEPTPAEAPIFEMLPVAEPEPLVR